MHARKFMLTVLSSAVIALQGLYMSVNPPADEQTTQKKESTQFIRYCDLVREPEKYSGQKVQTRAILIAVVASTADGATGLYSPDCDVKENHRVIVADHQTLLIPENELRKLDRALRKQKTYRIFARVEITVTGKFKFPMNDTIYKRWPSLEI